MFRFRSYRLIKFYSNNMQSFLTKSKYQLNINSLANTLTTQSDAFDVSKVVNIRNLDILREKRLSSMKKNSTSGEQDILNESIIKCQSIDHLNQLIDLHINVMNTRHLTAVFESINDIIKFSDNYKEDCLKFLSSNSFIQLCNQTVKRIRFFQISEILTTFKTLVFLNVSPNTTIIQSLLQMIRQMINDFSINDIIFLDFLLNKQMINKRKEIEDFNLEMNSNNFDSNRMQIQQIIPLIEALKLAIPLVLQLKIETKELNFDDIELVTKCLGMAAKHQLRDDVVNKLTVATSFKIPELTINQCYSVIASLITFPNTNTQINTSLVNRVINECFDKVTENGAPLPSSAHNFVLSLLLSSRTRRSFYHKGLFEMVANLIIQNPNKFENSKIIGISFALTRHSHIHYGLLDLIAERIAMREHDLIDNPKTSFTNILQGFALPTNYRPNAPNTEIVYKNILGSNHIQLSKQQKTKHLLFKTLRYLSILNYYPKEEIREWVTHYLEEALNDSTLMGLRVEFLETVVTIYQGLCLESNLSDFEDLKHIFKPLVEENNAFQYKFWEENPKSKTLEFALSQGLGGPQYIGNNMFTEFGHFVDHVVVIGRGGQPVPICDEGKTNQISQLKVPSDSKIIGIIPLTPRDYCRQPVIRRGETDFRLRTLRKSGILTIPINTEGWESLVESEKIPFIMREIQEISEEIRS